MRIAWLVLVLVALARPAAAAPCGIEGDGAVAGGPRQVIALCTEYIEAARGDAQDLAFAYNTRGAALAEVGAQARAVEDYDRAIALADPVPVVFHTNRAVAYLRLDEITAALADIDAALRIDPGSALAFYTRAGIRTETGEPHLALEDLDRALEVAPGEGRYAHARGIVRARLGDHAGAIEDFDRALEEDRTRAAPFYGLAEVYLRRASSFFALGDIVSAEEDFARAALEDPEMAGAHNGQAWALYLLGRPEEASEAVHRALALRPRYEAALDTRAHVLAALGRHDAAMAAFERAMEIGGEDRVRAYQQGLARRKLYAGPVDGQISDEMRAALRACVEAACTLGL